MGLIHKELEDMSAAELCFRRELEILLEKDPKSSDVSDACTNVSNALAHNPELYTGQSNDDW